TRAGDNRSVNLGNLESLLAEPRAGATRAALLLPEVDLAAALLELPHYLAQADGQPLGARPVHDHAAAHAEDQDRVLVVGTGNRQVHSEVQDDLVLGRGGADGVGVRGPHLALVDAELDLTRFTLLRSLGHRCITLLPRERARGLLPIGPVLFDEPGRQQAPSPPPKSLPLGREGSLLTKPTASSGMPERGLEPVLPFGERICHPSPLLSP